MSKPLLPVHRTGECTGTWQRHVVSDQPIWQCTRCGFAYPETLPVLGTVRTEEMLEQLLVELAADGAGILARTRQDRPAA